MNCSKGSFSSRFLQNLTKTCCRFDFARSSGFCLERVTLHIMLYRRVFCKQNFISDMEYFHRGFIFGYIVIRNVDRTDASHSYIFSQANVFTITFAKWPFSRDAILGRYPNISWIADNEARSFLFTYPYTSLRGCCSTSSDSDVISRAIARLRVPTIRSAFPFVTGAYASKGIHNIRNRFIIEAL